MRVEDEEAGLGAVLLDTSVRREVYREDVNRDGGGGGWPAEATTCPAKHDTDQSLMEAEVLIWKRKS